MKETIANCTDDGTTPPSTASPPACVGDPTPPAGTNIRSTMTYDGTGATVLTIVAVGTGDAASTQTAYDGAGRVQAVKDPLGTITRSFYDPAGGQLATSVVNCTTSGTMIPADWVNCTGAGSRGQDVESDHDVRLRCRRGARVERRRPQRPRDAHEL